MSAIVSFGAGRQFCGIVWMCFISSTLFIFFQVVLVVLVDLGFYVDKTIPGGAIFSSPLPLASSFLVWVSERVN